MRSPGLSSYRARVAVRVAGGALLAAVLALGLWGYRRPELFLDLARLPFC